MKKITRIGISAFITVLVLSGFVGTFGTANIASAESSSEQPRTNMPFPPAGGFRNRSGDDSTITSSTSVKFKLGAKISDDNATTTKNRGEMEKELRTRIKSSVNNFVTNFKAHVEKVTERLSAVFDRLTNIAGRIDTRLAKLSAQKVDVSVSTKFVASARQELKLAKMSIDAIAADFKLEIGSATTLGDTATSTNITASTSATAGVTIGGRNFRSIFTKSFADITNAKEHLKKAHAYLVQAIENIKPGLNGQGDNDHGTTTKVTTASTTVTASSSSQTAAPQQE